MARYRIFCFGISLPPVEGLEHLQITSNQSLLDADIVVIRPSLREFRSEGFFQGIRNLDDHSSFQVQNALTAWSSKIKAAKEAGKTIIYILPELEKVVVDTGERSYSGTGRNRQTTRHVANFDNYKFIPVLSYNPVFETGSQIVPARDIGVLATMFSHYKGRWRYNCYLNSEKLRPALVTKSGTHIVGAISPSGIIILPDIDFGLDDIWQYTTSGNYKYKDGRTVPTEAAEREALSFRDQLVALRDTQTSQIERTPPPDWAGDSSYRLPQEHSLEADINQLSRKLEELSVRYGELREQLADAGELRTLLFGTGKPLERAVRKALVLLGFSAVPFENGSSEFDVVFESEEGRFIGEVEGREAGAINVSKISQLRRNVDEDFARDEVESPAVGVLFGNGFRLEDPTSRSNCFTDKVVSSAPTLGIVLVRTADLFQAAQTFLETEDGEFARQCRRAIADSVGEIASFPKLERAQVNDASLSA